MLHKIRVAVAATLALTALTGCGHAVADASAAPVYEPLPSLSTATPTKSPSPVATSTPSPSPSPTPSPSVTPTAASTPAAGVAGSTGSVTDAPVPATAADDASALLAAPVAAGPVVAAPGAAGPVGVTETVSTTTSSVTSTTLEAQIMVVVTCEGWCDLSDLTAPELTGADGPLSRVSVQELLAADARRQGGDEPLTQELIESLAKENWDLREQQFTDGQEKFVFTSAADRR